MDKKMNWIGRTVDNMKKLLTAHAPEPEKNAQGFPLTQVEKQARYVDAQVDRCIRCGDLMGHFFPTTGPVGLCQECGEHLRTLDAPAQWFVEMLHTIKH